MKNLSGTLCPIVTPFDGGNVDYDGLEHLVDWLLDKKIDGIVPCGTTGEVTSLSETEYERVIETVSDRVNSQVPVIAGTAATSVQEAIYRLTKMDSYSIDGGLILPPYYHSPNDPKGVEQFFNRIASESPIPTLLYNIPQTVGYEIAVETAKNLAKNDNIIGIKNSSSDFAYLLDIIYGTPDDFKVFQGFDPLIVPAFQHGIDGVIAGLSNPIPEIIQSLSNSMKNNQVEEAVFAQQEIVAPLWKYSINVGFPAAVKSSLMTRGVISTNEVRPPLVNLPERELNKIKIMTTKYLQQF